MSEIFREKNIEKLNKPEDLNERIKVASPKIWMLLVGILALVIGAGVWAYYTLF